MPTVHISSKGVCVEQEGKGDRKVERVYLGPCRAGVGKGRV